MLLVISDQFFILSELSELACSSNCGDNLIKKIFPFLFELSENWTLQCVGLLRVFNTNGA